MSHKLFLSTREKSIHFFNFHRSSLFLFFFLSIMVWVFSFQNFLFLNERNLVDDAVSYYDHTKFYLDNLVRGIYPLWDPVYYYGAPNDFFLRRIGPFNPLLLVIVILNKLGLPFLNAYLFYLVGYYFLGMTGFYLVACRLFQNRTAAFAAFLLLAFSSLGTRVFDSYFLLIFVPMVWFFYFLMDFSSALTSEEGPKGPRARSAFVGITLTLVLLGTTYIPFYFLTIFLAFVACFLIVYPRLFKVLLWRCGSFAKNHFGLFCLCLLVLILSCAPTILFYQESSGGEIVFPHRQAAGSAAAQPAESVVQVKEHWIKWWAILEEIVYSSYFLKDLRNFQFAVIYLPVFVYVLFLLGLVAKVNRRMIFLALWWLGLFLIGVPDTTVYQFLYNHVFFFKYFRNLHFFLWIALIPLLILFFAEQWNDLLQRRPLTKTQKIAWVGYLIAAHGLVGFFLWKQQGSTISSYATVVFSLGFFLTYFLKCQKDRAVKDQEGRTMRALPQWALLSLLVITVLEPIEVYSYFSQRPRYSDDPIVPFEYEKPYLEFSLVREKRNRKDASGQYNTTPPTVFYCTSWLRQMMRYIDYNTFDDYTRYRFIVYDRVEYMDEQNLNYPKIEKTMARRANLAFIMSEAEESSPSSALPAAPTAWSIEENSAQFQILSMNVNSLRIKTHFDQPKFLVYNDSFHSGWKAFQNGKPVKLYRANVAFKGLWIPAGENEMAFHYGRWWQYLLEVALFLSVSSLLIYLVWMRVRIHAPS